VVVDDIFPLGFCDCVLPAFLTMRKLIFIVVAIFFSTAGFGQACTLGSGTAPWKNLICPSRAIDWGAAGLPATFPDGETTANPWAPPTRPACTTAQAGITVPVASGTSFASILTAMNNCSAANTSGSYLLLASGSFSIGTTEFLNTAPYVTLRGAGAMNTTLTLTASLQFGQGGGKGGGTVSTSPASGTTSVTLTSVSGTTPTVGNIGWFNQCDTGYSGSTSASNGYNTCTTGSYSDNGGLFVCGGNTICNSNGSGSGGGGQTSQFQYVNITSVTNNGGGSYTIGFSPGLYLNNWSTSNTASMYWQQQSDVGYGIGLEDMTIVFSGGGNIDIQGPAYASWIKGNRFIGATANRQILWPDFGKNDLVFNNYFFTMTPATPTSSVSAMQAVEGSDDLFLNNIEEFAILVEGAGSQLGDVIAYNFNRNNNNQNPFPSAPYQHDSQASGVALNLLEGNQGDGTDDDDTWGTGDVNTWFRNWYACDSIPFTFGLVKGIAIQVDAFHRFDNAIANVLGGTGQCTSYSGTSNGNIFILNKQGTDALASSSFMRWLNYDSVNASVQKNSAEVPTSMSGNAAPFENAVPSNGTTAPASFFMDSMGFFPSGGTGLSWWKVCNAGFNASTGVCGGTTSTPPFPTCGPDVTGGNEVSGYCYDNPASIAWQTLPIDTTQQNSYTITGGSWSNSSGTCSPAPAPCEILTVSGISTIYTDARLMGDFQINGGNCATSGAGTATGAKVQMTYATTTTVTYSLASNPGACTGTMLWPDVRQFDERVYETDSSSGASFTCSPSTVPANHSGHINLSCTGVGTGWNGSTAFSASGACTYVSTSNTSSTSQTVTVTTGGSTGTCTIADTTDSITSPITVATATLAISPNFGNISTTPGIALTGGNTVWTQETPSGLFSVSGAGCSGESLTTPTVVSNTSATATLTTGSAACTITVTDNSTGATTTFTVTSSSGATAASISNGAQLLNGARIQ